ncbi:MAG: 16S rRNA processing protein RimM [Ignavibacteriales bacterium]|nr:16S rRNA processing protein RimM [Ignavibacteriales bacterium]
MSKNQTLSEISKTGSNFIAVAKITGCFGVKGKLKIQFFASDSNIFDTLKNVRIGFTEDDSQPLEIEESEIHLKSPVIKISGVDDKNNAERFVNHFIFVEENKILPLPDGRYFIHDIIGCKIRSTDNKIIGVIKNVLKTPAHDLWVVEKNMKEFYIPVVKEFVKEVDIKNKKIIVELIEGLIEE